MDSSPQHLSINYLSSQFWVLSIKLWSLEVLTIFPFSTLHATCFLFLSQQIFRYPYPKYGSLDVFYSPWDFQRLLMGPKLTLELGFMPSKRNQVLNFTLDCFGSNSFIQTLFGKQFSLLEISLRALWFEL